MILVVGDGVPDGPLIYGVIKCGSLKAAAFFVAIS